jgi:hypothetical protein
MHPLDILLRVMFLSVALILLGFAAWHAIESILTIATHETANAEVVRCNPAGSPGTRLQTYDLEVIFQTAEGRQRATARGSQLSYDPGEQIRVYYVPETAFRAKPGGFFGLWGIPAFLSLIGGMFLFYGAWPAKKHK